MAKQFSFKNPVTGKPLAPKKSRTQKICGWEVDDVASQSLGIETWSHLQVQIHQRNEKVKHVPDYIVYKHLPKRRCEGLTDTDLFEKGSLHENFFKKTYIEEKAKSYSSQRRDPLPNGPMDSVAESRVQTAGVIRSSPHKTRDDLFVPYKEETNINNHTPPSPNRGLPYGLTRSVTDISEDRSPTMRRMLFYAKKYASKEYAPKEYAVYDEEEDEGYGSKTPSEEKEIKCFDSPVIINQLGSKYHQDVTNVTTNGPNVAKFTYTHQTTRSQFYGQFEDDPRYGDDQRADSCRQSSQYSDHSKENAGGGKRLERSYTVIGNKNEISAMSDEKPTSIILRKISIQNSQGYYGNHETVYDLQKAFSRSHTTMHEHKSEKEQNSVNDANPELKITHALQRPHSRVSNKVGIECRRSPPGDVLKKTHAGIFELHRSHTSICMPIGELLPMAEHFHQKSTSSTTTEPPQSLPNTGRLDLDGTPRIVNMDDASLEYYSINKNSTLCSGPFRQSKSSQSLTGNRNAHITHVDVYPHPASAILPSASEPRTRVTQSRSKEGLPPGSFLPKMPTLAVRRRKKSEKKPEMTTLEVSMGGIDIEIKQEFKAKLQRATTVGKIKLSTNPDRDTKKKLREAFSRFYNRRGYAPNRNVNWSEDLRYVWNT